jgi:hypothetical protein
LHCTIPWLIVKDRRRYTRLEIRETKYKFAKINKKTSSIPFSNPAIVDIVLSTMLF